MVSVMALISRASFTFTGLNEGLKYFCLHTFSIYFDNENNIFLCVNRQHKFTYILFCTHKTERENIQQIRFPYGIERTKGN